MYVTRVQRALKDRLGDHGRISGGGFTGAHRHLNCALQEFVVDSPDVTRGALTYRAATLDKGKANLTMRALYSDAPKALGSDAWEYLDDKTIGLLPRGTAFTAGSLYEFSYQATDPLVVGIGFAAVRDLATQLRQQSVIGRPAERIYTFGAS